MPIGTVLIQETKAPEGYFINDTVYLVKVLESGADEEIINTYNAPVTPEQVYTGSISINKTTVTGLDKHTVPEDGAKFEVYLKSAGSYAAAAETDRALLVTDDTGYAAAADLPYGTYTVHQVSGWEGNKLYPDFDVTISADGQSYHFALNNERFYAFVMLKKVDATTGQQIPVSGVGFQLKDPTGQTVSDLDGVSTWYTDANGILRLPVELEYGKRYSLLELSAPHGYVIDRNPLYFDLVPENSTVENDQNVILVEKANTPQMGTITVKKTGEYYASVTETDGKYQPVYRVGGLAGAEFQVTAAEDTYTPDGTLRYRKDAVVATLVTADDGTAVTDPLYLGKYTVTETKAPHGMILNSASQGVELTYAGQNVEITETATGFYNERQKIEIDLKKVMEKDEIFGVGNGNEITSVTFGLYAAEDITAADGRRIPADGLIETVTCDNTGYAAFRTDLPVDAKTYVKEISTDSHYILSDAKYPVDCDYAGQNTATVQITVNGGKEISNELIYGTIKGNKVNRETGEEIAGALFGLFHADETDFTAANALLTAESNEDGVFLFQNVVYGSYVVRELRPAAGYLEHETAYDASINTDGAIDEITVVNDLIPEIGTTATIDGEKEVCATEVFTLTDTVEYKHLVPGKEYTVKGILMDKATGEPYLANGEQVTSEVTFTPEAPTGSIDVLYTFDAKLIKADTEIVVFESLYSDSKELTVHADLEDADQTVTIVVPEIKTEASAGGKKKITIGGDITIEDTVSYHNLTPGKAYVVRGTLMDKATGEPITVDDAPVVGETTFTPESRDGDVKVTYTFPSSVIVESTDIVVFERLYREDVAIAVHTDLEDEGQTVTVLVPRIKTMATVNGKKAVTTSGKVTIEDVVSYTNLIPGTEYTVKGVLMDQRTGKPFEARNVVVTAETTFVPEESEGTVEVVFAFDVRRSSKLVVFEELYGGEYLLASHTDLADEDQTVQIRVPRHVESSGTGDKGVTMAVITAQAAVFGCLLLRKKRSKFNFVSR